ncbi:MAG: hypothetical protein LUC26_02640 [Prevotella sp.]|nr:hypothetical protein [Prevotella sp.]
MGDEPLGFSLHFKKPQALAVVHVNDSGALTAFDFRLTVVSNQRDTFLFEIVHKSYMAQAEDAARSNHKDVLINCNPTDGE